MKILVLGPAGTHTHQAALSAFEGAEQSISFVDTNKQVLEGVMKERCLGVVPIENSLGGLVRPVVDYWIDSNTSSVFQLPRVIGEISIHIRHDLICHPGIMSTGQLTSVSSHPQALAQCGKNLASWSMLKTKIPAESTARAVQDLASGKLPQSCAVLASSFAAREYGMTITATDMQDSKTNITRFHAIAHPEFARAYTAGIGRNDGRTAMIIYVENTPRSLLSALWSVDVDMTSIHSIPLGKPNEYAFYLEFNANLDYDAGNKIMIRLKTVTTRIVVLGSYSQSSMWKARIA